MVNTYRAGTGTQDSRTEDWSLRTPLWQLHPLSLLFVVVKPIDSTLSYTQCDFTLVPIINNYWPLNSRKARKKVYIVLQGKLVYQFSRGFLRTGDHKSLIQASLIATLTGVTCDHNLFFLIWATTRASFWVRGIQTIRCEDTDGPYVGVGLLFVTDGEEEEPCWLSVCFVCISTECQPASQTRAFTLDWNPHLSPFTS